MTLEDFKAALQADEVVAITGAAAKKENITAEDKDILVGYIRKSSEALGEDQIAEPIRYIVASMGGLRKEDLEFLIGEDFDAELFDNWNNLHETPVIATRSLTSDVQLYDVAPKMRELLRKEMGDANFRSCASDIGYYLLEHKAAGDIIRDTQTLHLLLDGMEAAAAAEYLSEAEGNPLALAVKVLSQAFVAAPEGVIETIWDMTRAEGEKINLQKILLILLNDCVAAVGNPEKTKPMVEKLHGILHQLVASGHNEIAILLGAAKLRIAQNARMRRVEQEAQQAFIGALNYIMPPLQQADPKATTSQQIHHYWLCLKICQEMAQPKAMSLIFEQIIKLEQAQTQDESRSEEERGVIAENIMNQHIDMSKVFYSMPKPMQEQFTNYSEPTVALLKAYLENSSKETAEGEATTDTADIMKLSGYYQSLGELCMHLERHEESYEALTEAQILQMRHLAALQKEDGNDTMSSAQLICHLALSATNHMIASHYRRNGKNKHDLGIILRSNMNLAESCFKFYARDSRVLHFFINAALELGDYLHQTRGILAESGTYEKVVRELSVINNMNLDQQLAVDVAMIFTKCGQVQSDKNVRRYKDAIRNLNTAHNLWKALGDNTKNQTFINNANAVQNMLQQLGGKK